MDFSEIVDEWRIQEARKQRHFFLRSWAVILFLVACFWFGAYVLIQYFIS